MDKGVQGLMDAVRNHVMAGGTDNAEWVDEAVWSIESRLIPEDARDRVARWLWTKRPPNPTKFADCLTAADSLLAELADRERQDAAPPAPETCPECGGKVATMPAKMMFHNANCRAVLNELIDGTGSTDADGGEG